MITKKKSNSSQKYQPHTLLFLFVCLLSFGCKEQIKNNIDAEFQSYVDLFFIEAIERGYIEAGQEKPLDIQFAIQDELPTETTRGICSGLGGHEIRINRTYWDEMHSSERELLISHEIGHCLLSRSHLEDIINDCSCSTIMYPGVSGSSCVADLHSPIWRKYFYDELFNIDVAVATEISNNDFSNWTRLLKRTYVDSIPQDFELDEGVSYELNFTFKNSEMVNLVSDQFELNVNFDYLGILRFMLSRDDLQLRYGDDQFKFIDKPFTIRILLKDRFIYVFIDDILFHNFEFNDRSFKNIMLSTEMQNLESFNLYEIQP